MRNLSEIKKDKSLRTIKKAELNKIKGGTSDGKDKEDYIVIPDDLSI